MMSLLVHVMDVFEIWSLHSRWELRGLLLVYNGSFLCSSFFPLTFSTSLWVRIESNRKAHYPSGFFLKLPSDRLRVDRYIPVLNTVWLVDVFR